MDSTEAVTQERRLNIEKLFPGAVVVGVVGLIAALFFMFAGPANGRVAVEQSYVFAWFFWATVALGCFLLLNLHHMLRGMWTLSIMRLLEAGGGPVGLGVIAVTFLPMLALIWSGDGNLYPWANKALVAADQTMVYQHPYMNPTAVTFRFVLFFTVWIAIGAGMVASARRQEKTGELSEQVMRGNWSPPGFISFVLMGTFGFTDWIMSMDPHWTSTMYALWLSVGSALGALSLCTLLLCVNADRPPYNRIVTPKLTRDLGNMLFTLTMLWAYTSLSQYLIIWSGNLPEQNHFYVNRSLYGWGAIGAVTIFGQFFIPFVALLTPRVKRIPILLAKWCGWIFVIHLVDVYEIVKPTYQRTPGTNIAWDVVTVLSIGLIWLGAFAGQLRQRPLIPTYDDRLLEAARDAH